MTPERLAHVIAAPDQASEDEKCEAIVAMRDAEPVAWRYRHVNYVDWSYSKDKPKRGGLDAEPLFARARSLLERQP